MASVEEWFNNQGWKENPFSLKIYPDLFVGYEDQTKALLNHIKEHHKIALVSGSTGSGKTTLLRWLEKNGQNGSKVLYVSKLSDSPEGIVNVFLDALPLGLIERLLRRRPNISNLSKYANKKLGNGELVMLIDEFHETPKDVLEWIRVLADQVQGMHLVIAGLPVLEQKLKSELETFDQRITTRARLTALSEAETKELIKRRIELVGGRGIEPFSDDVAKTIYERTGGFPREVLKMCDKLVNSALSKNLMKIDSKVLEDFKELPKTEPVAPPSVSYTQPPPAISDIPYKQKKVMEILAKEDWLTPTAIAERLDSKAYKTKQHAIRSINNILKRMMLDKFVQRESRGKAFVYSLLPRVKTLFVEA